MWKPRKRGTRNGWVLPDALLALAIVCLAVTLTQDFLQTSQRLEQQRQAKLTAVRRQHDRALLAWVAAQ
ncbi:hypothetical protein [Levilactobacillus cerevisiae]|uniref:hypothetical protein n=1 Tax=Levilactobacillus cerevisiae TaxID=1704076 RepID=UPI000F77F078|nr:hypothetical protein [Levilactobacillus cerevisiae]